MNKKILFSVMIIAVVILAGINVKMSGNMTSPVGLSLKNIEAISDEGGGSSVGEIKHRICYNANDIQANSSSSYLIQNCPANSGDWCPDTHTRGYATVLSHVCHYQ
jgi:hypothetical protein